jgi:CMP-N,N'-diacetyllegionaminic acid synthase
MKALAMIPARSGSKGLKDKNILDLAGKPMIAHSIIPALNCNLIDSVYLNSDSEKYLKIGEQFGAIGYKRSENLSSYDTPMKSVIEDFCKYIKQTDNEIDCIVVLYPTYPFRDASDIGDFVQTFRSIGGERSIVGLKVPDTHPCLIYDRLDNGGLEQYISEKCTGMYRRQEYPVVYELTHWICVVPIDGISELNSQMINEHTFGYLIGKDKIVVDVDIEKDYLYAKYILSQN